MVGEQFRKIKRQKVDYFMAIHAVPSVEIHTLLHPIKNTGSRKRKTPAVERSL